MRKILTLLFCLQLCSSLSAAPFRLYRERQVIPELAEISPAHLYATGIKMYKEKRWEGAVRFFRGLAIGYPQTSYGQDAHFFLGVSYFHLGEFDRANHAFNGYLQLQSNPEYFEKVMEYKLAMAYQLRNGLKARLFGNKKLPKIGDGGVLAIELYDDIILAMPNHPIAEQALYGQGKLLAKKGSYHESIEAFQTLITRFPKGEYAPESFLAINQTYLEQARKEHQNPDILALAEINLEKFEEQFPGEERLEEAREDVRKIKEVSARGMLYTARFYERVDQPRAAILYYQKVILDFPETSGAEEARCRLAVFCPLALEEVVQSNG